MEINNELKAFCSVQIKNYEKSLKGKTIPKSAYLKGCLDTYITLLNTIDTIEMEKIQEMAEKEKEGE